MGKIGRPKKHLTREDVIALAKEYCLISYGEKQENDITIPELREELKCSRVTARKIVKKLLADGKVKEVKVRVGPYGSAKAYRPI